jgi:hypothetical protein
MNFRQRVSISGRTRGNISTRSAEGTEQRQRQDAVATARRLGVTRICESGTAVTDDRNNHYVPQFLLERWCNAAGKLTVYTRRHGRVVISELSPRGTAFETNLYTYHDVSADRRHAIENEFMTAKIDTPAAPIVEKILRGTPLTSDERSDFTRFMMALRNRHPDAVAMAREKGAEALMAALARNPEEYMAIRDESSPESLTEWVSAKVPSLIRNFGTSVVPAMIAHEPTGRRLFEMPWWTHDVRNANTDLLISDRPCILEGNALNGGCVIVLPLSPTALFFISNRPQQTHFLQTMPATKLVRMVNKASVWYAANRVYSTGKHHLALVEKYLGLRAAAAVA